MENTENKPEDKPECQPGLKLELPPIPQPPPPEKHVDRICTEVTFRGNRKMYYLVARGANITTGDLIIADIDKGSDVGRVTLKGKMAELKKGAVSGHNIIRKANDQDLEKMEKIKKEENQSYSVCKDKIAQYGLEMSLVEVERQFDESKTTFYFLAEQRVDFRELVKDLAGTFRTRIELRQIGVRDEAKRVDGIGVCGRHLCCSAFLTSFEQISTQMARTQHLSLNQSKLSGNCGRLKCCLKYELSFYEEMNHCMPQPGSKIKGPKGEATVIGLNIMKNQVKIFYQDTGTEDFLTPEECKGVFCKEKAEMPKEETPKEDAPKA